MAKNTELQTPHWNNEIMLEGGEFLKETTTEFNLISRTEKISEFSNMMN